MVSRSDVQERQDGTTVAPAADWRHLPLVSVGIPTYNRMDMLQRAVKSVLAQDYINLEVIISDNASTDGTRAYCEELAQRDCRVRYIRQSRNIGPTANMVTVLDQSRGDFYMLLCDDDWLDRTYVSDCVSTLLERPELILVCGKPLLYEGDRWIGEGVKTNLLQDCARDRVRAYFRQVEENGAVHGLIRRNVLMRLPSMPNIMGGDWLYVASIAFLGKVKTLDSSAIHKSKGGISRTPHSLRQAMGLTGFKSRFQRVNMLASVIKDIAWTSPVYERLGASGRLSLAAQVALGLLTRVVAREASKRARYRLLEIAPQRSDRSAGTSARYQEDRQEVGWL